MADITYNIAVDRSAGTATVTTTPKDAKFKVGETVEFKSDNADTAIEYASGSPFSDYDGEARTLPQGPFTLKDRTQTFRCSCGRMISGKFSPWQGGTNTPPPKG